MDGKVAEPYLPALQLGVLCPCQRAQRRCLADAVAAEQGHDITFGDLEADTLNDVALPVIGVDVLHAEERRAGGGIGLWRCQGVHRCAPPR